MKGVETLIAACSGSRLEWPRSAADPRRRRAAADAAAERAGASGDGADSALVTVTCGAGGEARKAGGHHALIGFQALGDDRLHLILLRHRHRPHRDLVVRLHDIDEGAVRSALHGRGRRHHHLLERVGQQPDVDEAARPELQLAVGEFGLELDRAGRRIDLIVDDLELAGLDHGLVVGAERVHRQRAAGERAIDLAELLLRQGEQHRDRLELGDDDDAARVGGVHDVALVDLADAGAAGDRRDDRWCSRGSPWRCRSAPDRASPGLPAAPPSSSGCRAAAAAIELLAASLV